MLYFILKNHKLRSAYFSKRFNSVYNVAQVHRIGSIFQDEDVNTAIQKRRLLARTNRKYINKEKVHGRSQILSYHLVKSGDANQTEAKYMCLEKGVDKQCACGYWFKLIDDDLNDF
ncbi:hypothetical protein T09_2308 [Trichinella sp. T9]|nr:hypothetical protein T09_2308 [Trichinella sp. T9]